MTKQLNLFAATFVLTFAFTANAQQDVTPIEVPKVRVDETLLNDLQPNKRARLGIVIEELSPQLASHLRVSNGVYVVSVDADGPADKAGIKTGDVIVMAGDQPIETVSDLMAAVAQNGGAKLSITIDGPSGKKNAEVEPVMVAEAPVKPMDFEELDSQVAPRRGRGTITGDIIQQLMNDFGSQLDGRTMDDLGGLAQRLLGSATAKHPPLPSNFKIEIQRQDNGAAEVTAEVDGETFATDSDNLNALPESVRSRVDALLNGSRGTHLDFGDLQIDLNRGPLFRGRIRKLDRQPVAPPAFKDQPLDQAPPIPTPGGINDLRSEIEQLRREMQQLKSQLQPKTPDLREFD